MNSDKLNDPTSRPDSKMITNQDINLMNTQQHINWNPLNSTTPNPHFIRVDTEHDAMNNQIFTQGCKDHNLNIITNNTI